MRLTCEELAARVVDELSQSQLSAAYLHDYERDGASKLLEHFASQGLRHWSAAHAVTYLRALREDLERGKLDKRRFFLIRKTAALMNEMDAVGFLSGNTLPDYSDENPLVLLFDRGRCGELADADAGIYSLAAKASIETARLGIHASKKEKCFIAKELSSVVAFFVECGQRSYSDEVLDAYVQHVADLLDRGDISAKRSLRARRVAMYVRSVANSGSLEWSALRRGPTVSLPSKLEGIVEGFSAHLRAEGLAESTIRGYAQSARVFLQELARRGVDVPRGMTPKDVRDAVIAARLAKGSANVPKVSAVRAFCRFCASTYGDVGVTDLSAAIPPPPPKRRRAIRGFDAHQSRKFLEAPDRGTAKGKRDFAILSLMHVTGMRPCDIVRLEFESIDWRSGCIRLIQKKTSEPLVVPLDAEAGNAIATYILDARPQTEDRRLFVRHQRPYIGLSRDAVRDIIIAYGHVLGDNPGVPITPKSFRIGFSEGMTKAGVSLDGTRDMMGHLDWSTTRRYIPPDVERLQMCPLGLNCIPIKREELL